MEFPDERVIDQELRTLATPHIQKLGGVLVALEHNPEKYPEQSFKVRDLEGDPAPSAMVESIATAVDERFPVLLEKLDELENGYSHISQMGELLKSDTNIVLATNHSDLVDVALVLAAYYCSLRNRDYENFNTGIMISKMIAHLGYRIGGREPAPAAEVLQILCNDIFLSFPRTRSISNSRIAGYTSGVEFYNRGLRRQMANKQRAGRNLWAIALSGTTDKPAVDDPDTLVMGGVGDGTAKILSAPHTLVMPVGIWLRDEQIIMEPSSKIAVKVSNKTDADHLMTNLASCLSDHVPNTNFRYESAAR